MYFSWMRVSAPPDSSSGAKRWMSVTVSSCEGRTRDACSTFEPMNPPDPAGKTRVSFGVVYSSVPLSM